MLREFRMDLHIHTCLSPCGDDEMVPAKIVDQAKKSGLDVIGICDHNTAENVPAVRCAGSELNLRVLGGMEITTQEEVHILALFDETMRPRSGAIEELAARLWERQLA